MSEADRFEEHEIQANIPVDEILPIEGTHPQAIAPPDAVSPPDSTSESRYWRALPGESPELYERLGVRTFKKYMPTTGDLMRKHVWSRLGPSSAKMGGLPHEETRRASLEKLVEKTKTIEVIHLGGFAVNSAMVTAAEVTTGGGDTRTNVYAALITLGNIGLNAYPLMLQRYNRLRAYRLLDRLQDVETKQADEATSAPA